MEVDVTGMVCPQPVAVVRRRLEDLEPGDELVVVGDFPPAERSIYRACVKHGYDVSDGPPTDDGEFSVRIRVTESSAHVEAAADEGSPRALE